MGKNGSNVDTLMFANINSNTGRVTLISIPRDLYVNDRKINSVYADYGIREQVRWIENIVGYQIQKYILVDMYVFKDLIDLMGGVDVTLEEDLVDPTYKVCDAGICGTLNYPAGTYHLDGTAALRVARSRHTSSDYSRAARQQLILEAMQSQARSLGLGDANTILAMIGAMIRATDTDIAVDEALRYFFRYQNFSIDRGHVLSTANVLVSEKVPVDYVTSLWVETCLDPNIRETCKGTYAIYTLAPRDGNWDSIHQWVRDLL